MKKRSLLKNVCRILVGSMTSHKSITEDQVHSLMDELAAEEPKALSDMPDDYKKLSSYIGEFWRYREWQEMTSEQAFLYGGVWGSVKPYEDGYRKVLDADWMKLLVSKYKDKYWLFYTIKSQPGILHKELAQKGRISPSRLSQIMDDKDIFFLISYRLSGREKYYFLKPQGEELLKRLKPKERKMLGSYAEPYKAIDVKNNSTTEVYAWVIGIAGISENFYMPGSISFRQRDKIKELIGSDLGTNYLLGVNEWMQKASYMNLRRTSPLQNGLEMSSAK